MYKSQRASQKKKKIDDIYFSIWSVIFFNLNGIWFNQGLAHISKNF